MVFITEELIRKKSEHNEGIIGTLEELSLHQEDIEKIEHLNNWCKGLQILYLQANQIAKIENLNKLKQLKYLNLAINNIEKIENLERCESLEKLDLTLNFVGDLESVKSLKANLNLRTLYLTGNPCCDYKGYKDYIIAHLPQLENLDIANIARGERIRAQQNLAEIEEKIKQCQKKYRRFREDQKARLRNSQHNSLTNEEFWQTVSENSPETRLEISKRQNRGGKHVNDTDTNNNQRSVRLFSKTGKPLNINQAKLDFKLSDENPEMFVLDVSVYKYLDTSLIDIDLQPIYVKLTIKGKIFQIVFPEEVHVERSTALRSQTTGHLVLNLPILNYKAPLAQKVQKHKNTTLKEEIEEETLNNKKSEYLEVTGPKEDLDFSKIVENNAIQRGEFHDNPEVPMLEYG